ncbi:heat shock 70 kDa protein 1 [Lingula anatina]|uniref:Heat shock 70 kDa protein 1 n=1 Tax=Lingula anatina TaxID=7574 RepID=A0A1S3JLJ3_LINAN|nr:heat shock 70 kDa protein 1 [Lingula anatina]|eukprot:XP_013411001.1 heat shock 70 kDa protein 1 [Lingula anatina]
MSKPGRLALGIDLGTNFSCVGVHRHGRVEIVPNDFGNRTTASYVTFTDSGRLVGDSAKEQAIINSSNTVCDAKKLIGRSFNDVTHLIDRWPFSVSNDGGKPTIHAKYKGERQTFAPEEISAMVLAKLKESAEAYLGQAVTDAVITVPVDFSEVQRQATLDAAVIAGLNVLRIITEPTAAVLAYGLPDKLHDPDIKNVLVFDLGGNSLQVSVLSSEKGIYKILTKSVDAHLGGEEFDNRMVNYFVKEFKRRYQKNISKDKHSIHRLRIACEHAKRVLSNNIQANVEVENLFEGIDYFTMITRSKFEEICIDLFFDILKPVERALKDCRLDKCDIHDIILVGGATHNPKIQQVLQNFMGGKELKKSISPDEVVAHGASLQAALLTGVKDDTTKDLTPVTIDLVPLSLGIETTGRKMTKLIQRDSIYPITVTQIFTTDYDNQPDACIHVYEGEEAMAKDNHLLATFELTGIRPAPRGVPRVEVTFHIDEEGLLHVTSKDISSGSSTSMDVNIDRTLLSKEAMGNMMTKADKFFADHDQSVDSKKYMKPYVLGCKKAVISTIRKITSEV